MKLETKIASFLADYPPEQTFNVIAHALWPEAGGWSSNDRFRIASHVYRDDIPSIARGRWEVFKANYAPRATVKGLQDIGYDPNYGVMLEVDYLPFIDIEPA